MIVRVVYLQPDPPLPSLLFFLGGGVPGYCYTQAIRYDPHNSNTFLFITSTQSTNHFLNISPHTCMHCVTTENAIHTHPMEGQRKCHAKGLGSQKQQWVVRQTNTTWLIKEPLFLISVPQVSCREIYRYGSHPSPAWALALKRELISVVIGRKIRVVKRKFTPTVIG